ncbi:uncharacterized protein V1516DRAFT_676905 [Lipomyces oligophaga]|uniref:uncharacterized protein n=1 Tax=Lipomyces oligophaga TaxID=45792 RepID=UPI0034CD8138
MPPKKGGLRGASLQELLEKLNVHVDNEEHTSVIDLADRVLKQDPDDRKALKSKIVALIKLERFDSALELALKYSDAILEACYCLYSLGRLDEASAKIDEALVSSSLGPVQTRGLKHLKGQVAYRQERFADAAQVYDELSKSSFIVDGEAHDVLVNELAINAQQRWWNATTLDVPAVQASSHEQAFNLATVKISEGNCSEALSLLERAKELTLALEDFTAQEIKEELNPILIQASFVHLALGEPEKATEILSTIDLNSTSDPLTRDLVINNLLAAGSAPGYTNENPHISLRRLDSVKKNKASSGAYIRLQKKMLSRNRLSIEYLAGKEAAVKRGIKLHLEQYPEDGGISILSFRPPILDSFSTGGKFSNKNLLGRSLKRFAKEPSNVGLGLAIIQMLIEKHNVDRAAQVMNSMLDAGVRYPGVDAVAKQIKIAQMRK